MWHSWEQEEHLWEQGNMLEYIFDWKSSLKTCEHKAVWEQLFHLCCTFSFWYKTSVILKGKVSCILHLLLLLTSAKFYFLSIVYCSASKANLFFVKVKMYSYVYSSCAIKNLMRHISLFAKKTYVAKWIVWKIIRMYFFQ